MSEDWKWLEEIESLSNAREDQWDDLSAASSVPKLIACIKEMREAFGILLKDYESMANSEWSPDWEDEAYMKDRWPEYVSVKETLNSCARGSFNE